MSLVVQKKTLIEEPIKSDNPEVNPNADKEN